MRSLLFGVALCLSPLTTLAQSQIPGVFRDYQTMRGVLDELVNSRSIILLMEAFGGAGEISPQDMIALEAQMRSVYPSDFIDHALMREAETAPGFRQQLIAYWDQDYKYVYVHLVLHDRGDELVAIQMSFNSDINAFLPLY
ncbi:hypothetical protein E2K80_07220 [Rhodophyticola sp. CCM32]|uniref:hypothetical protein n=1 Tax=Rhodophyticola sp. CCM32 TaxID=2916397 RepID=UPI00107F6599|nr:hypothetical protein [Rhodophyticola sp. CCM32]QBY00554.1 hypothetical protein E2K80_07220 [Rhodophyticola sp. CCM32]